MPQVNIFKWRPGSGWIVLSGGGDPASGDVQAIEAASLTRTLSQGPIAYLWAAGDVDSADRHMDLLRDLGARTGDLVDLVGEDDDVIYRDINEAGVIILGDGPSTRTLRDALEGIALSAIAEAFERGATVYAAGASAGILGAAFVERGTLY